MLITKVSDEISAKLANMCLVCAVMVVLIHMPWAESTSRLCWWSYTLTSNGVCRIANSFFFACAGFLLAGHVGESGWWQKAVRQRCRTLLVPYLAWSLIFLGYLAIKVCLGWVTEIPNLNRFAGLYLFDQPQYGLLWFVRALFFLVVFSPLVIWGIKKATCPFLMLLFALNLAGYWARTGTIGYFLGEFVGFTWMFYFAFGLAVRLGYISCPKWRRFMPLVFLGAGVMFLSYLTLIFLERCTVRYLCLRCFVPLMLMIVWRLMPVRRWPKWLTSCAFPLYLTHLINVDIFCTIFSIHSCTACWQFYGCFAFAVVVSAIEILLCRIFGKKLCPFLFGGR